LIEVSPGSAVKGGVVVSFDPQGAVLAVGAPRGQIRLYDVRKYDAGPFARFATPAPLSTPAGGSSSGGGGSSASGNPPDFTHLSFSPDGRQFAAATADGTIFLHDAFSGASLHVLEARTLLNEGPPAGTPFQPGYSADGSVISAGSADGFVHHWSTSTGQEVATWRAHAGHVGCVAWSKSYHAALTVDQNIALWLPTMENGTPVAQPGQAPGNDVDGDSKGNDAGHSGGGGDDDDDDDDDMSDDASSMGLLPSAAVDEASMSHSDLSS
jgi:COMPASS component SWD2